MKPVIIVAAICFAFTAAARCDTPAEAFARLDAAVKKELKSQKAEASPQDSWKTLRDQQRASLLNQLQSFIARQDFEHAEEALNQGMFALLTTDEEQKEATNLANALRGEREAKQNSRIAEAEAVLKPAADAVRSAKDPKELDPVLADLSRYFNQGFDNRTSDRARAVFGRMQPAHRFVQHWQEYLAALKSGNVKEAQSALKRASNEQGVDLIPRSEVMDRLEKLSAQVTEDKSVSSTQIDEIVGRVKGPDGLSAAIAQLQDLRGGRTGSFSEALINTISALSALERMYSEFQAGLPFKFDPAVVHVPAFA